MAKTNTKLKIEHKKPVGIYGGETNGSNPLEWTLRSTICAQLRKLGWYCTMDSFGDKSASWIEVYKENPNVKKEGKMMSFSIQFDYDGQIIQDIRFFEEQVYLKRGEASKLF